MEKYYDNRAPDYDSQVEEFYKGPKVAEALSSLVADKGRKILDVAAGTGWQGSIQGRLHRSHCPRLEQGEFEDQRVKECLLSVHMRGL